MVQKIQQNIQKKIRKRHPRSMRMKIQKSMMVILAVTLVLFYVILSVILYNQNLSVLRAEVRQEAKYICTAVNISGTQYLEQMDNVDRATRVTRIAKDGSVLYDSRRDAETLDNHGGREEVREAVRSGEGEDVRRSVTVKKDLYYYALLLDDGSVLRVSREVDSLVSTALDMLPVIGGLAVLMIIFAMLLAKWQTARLIKPINELDLENPLDNDIYTELSPLLTAMDKQNKEKEAVSNMRKEFSANVSHELKTPLTSISGYAEIMKNGMVRPEDMKKFSERIYNEASRLITLVEDIIKLSKLDEGEIEVEKEDVDLYEMTREIVSRLAPQAQARKVRVEVTGESVIYHGIRQVLDEMIYNICENAIKYNKEGGSLSVWVGGTLQGKKVIVTDTGIGIPKDQQERIFERFYRVDKSHSKETGGTGLGLSIVKHGAMIHDAQIHVESEVGKGTKMEITF